MATASWKKVIVSGSLAELQNVKISNPSVQSNADKIVGVNADGELTTGSITIQDISASLNTLTDLKTLSTGSNKLSIKQGDTNTHYDPHGAADYIIDINENNITAGAATTLTSNPSITLTQNATNGDSFTITVGGKTSNSVTVTNAKSSATSSYVEWNNVANKPSILTSSLQVTGTETLTSTTQGTITSSFTGVGITGGRVAINGLTTTSSPTFAQVTASVFKGQLDGFATGIGTNGTGSNIGSATSPVYIRDGLPVAITGAKLTDTTYTAGNKITITGTNNAINHASDYTAHTSSLYKFANDAYGHISSATAVVKSDLDNIIGLASTTQNGLMPSGSVTKLDGIQAGAQVNTLEGVQVNGVDLTITNKKVNIPKATTTTLGVVNVDSALSGTSENPVQNRAISSSIDNLQTQITNNATRIEEVYAAIPDVPAISTVYDSTINLQTNAGTAIDSFTLNQASNKTIRLPFLPLAGGTMSGNIDMNGNYIQFITDDNPWVDSERSIPFSEDGQPSHIKYYNTGNTGLTYNPNTGRVTATGFKTPTGTSTQFLKADGTVDSTTYVKSTDIGNGTLTIRTGSTNIGTFTANQTGNTTITLPSKLSEFTDDVVAGKYLPLTGGTMSGSIRFLNTTAIPQMTTKPNYIAVVSATTNGQLQYAIANNVTVGTASYFASTETLTSTTQGTITSSFTNGITGGRVAINGLTSTSRPTFAGITLSGSISQTSTVSNSLAGTNINGDLLVTGNMTIAGTTTYINTENTTVNDRFITLNYKSGSTATTPEGGIVIGNGSTGTGPTLFYDGATSQRWAISTYNSLSTGTSTWAVPNGFVSTVYTNELTMSGSTSTYTLNAAKTSIGQTIADKVGNIYIDSNNDIYIYA